MSIPDAIRGFAGRALNSPTVGNTFWVGAASLMTALAGAAASALIGRVLGVEDFGIYTLVISLVTMMVALSDLGISGSIVRFAAEAIARDDHRRLRLILSVALRAKAILGICVLAAAVLFLNPIVAAVFKHVDERITRYFLLSLLVVAVGMVAGFFPPIFQSFQRFRLQAVVTVIPPLVKVALIAATAFIFSMLTITTGILIELGTACVLLLLCWRLSPSRDFSLREDDPPLRKQMLSFNKWLALYYILNLLGGRIDLFLVGGLSDARALGLYGAASKAASMVVIMSNSYLTVLLPELSAALTPEQVRRKQRHSFLVVGLFAAGIVLLAALADILVAVIFGKEFAGAGTILRVMCIGLLFTVLAYPLNATLFAWNRSVVFPLMSGVAIAALVLGNIYLIPRFGAVGAAGAFSIGGFVGFLISAVIYFVHARTRPQ